MSAPGVEDREIDELGGRSGVVDCGDTFMM
jgi:hypothetical protein